MSKPRSRAGSQPVTYTSPQGVFYRPYAGESDLPHVMNLVQTELSEPYVVYTYRYFLQGWPSLSFLAFPEDDEEVANNLTQSSRANQESASVPKSDARPVEAPSQSTTQLKQQQEPIGAIVCKQSLHKHSARRGYIAMLSVSRAWRKRGIASTLVKLAIEMMIRNGADEVILETEVDNTAALGLYTSLGFIREKRLFRFYMNGKDAYRLVLPLLPYPLPRSELALPWEPLVLEDVVPVTVPISASHAKSLPIAGAGRRWVDSTQSPDATPPDDRDEHVVSLSDGDSVMGGARKREMWRVPVHESMRYSDDDTDEEEAPWYQSER